MSSQTLGILIGGLLPAFIFGLGNFLVKVSNAEGITVGILLILSGLGSIVGGLITLLLLPGRVISVSSGIPAFGFGFCMAVGTALVSIALVKHTTPLSVLAPLYNMNTLVAVLLALWLFSEWKQVQVPQLLFGSILITAGAALVARA